MFVRTAVHEAELGIQKPAEAGGPLLEIRKASSRGFDKVFGVLMTTFFELRRLYIGREVKNVRGSKVR